MFLRDMSQLWGRVLVQGKLTADGRNNKDRLETPSPVPECGKVATWLTHLLDRR